MSKLYKSFIKFVLFKKTMITFVVGQTLHGTVPTDSRNCQVVVQVAGLVVRAIGLHVFAGDGKRGPRGCIFGDAKILRNFHNEFGVDLAPGDRIYGRRRSSVTISDLLDDRLALVAPT